MPLLIKQNPENTDFVLLFKFQDSWVLLEKQNCWFRSSSENLMNAKNILGTLHPLLEIHKVWGAGGRGGFEERSQARLYTPMEK